MAHVKQQSHFDDIIKGKGKGLVFLLHGPPGLGKTLTAESVADHVEQPLYSISSGDLGVNAATVEKTLSNALLLAERWSAVLLIDEADVFLTRRSDNDLRRNALVSEHDYRKKLWINLISACTPGPEKALPAWLGDSALSELAEIDINGRQIKNAVSIAHALAVSKGEEITKEAILKVTTAMASFDNEFTSVANDNTVVAHEEKLADTFYASDEEEEEEEANEEISGTRKRKRALESDEEDEDEN
ncbi:MAG: hypothetical protein Q9160_000182 [Pyrenula sp. 1 TL-2023]